MPVEQTQAKNSTVAIMAAETASIAMFHCMFGYGTLFFAQTHVPDLDKKICYDKCNLWIHHVLISVKTIIFLLPIVIQADTITSVTL